MFRFTTLSILSATALMLGGCNGMDGIWLLYIDASEADPQDICSETVDHNFIDATVPVEEGPDSPWTETITQKMSAGAIFVQVVDGKKGKATMVVDDSVYLGEKGDGGEWTFKWDANDTTTDENVHQSGYRYFEKHDSQQLETYKLTFDGSAVKGSYSFETQAVTSYEESDDYNDTVPGVSSSGNIPAGIYLEVPAGPNTVPATNAGGDTDCDSGNCKLTITDGCADAVQLTGDWTGYKDESSYFGLEDAQRPQGI